MNDRKVSDFRYLFCIEDNDEMEVDASVEPVTKKQKVALGKPPKFTKARLKKYFDKYKDEENQVGPEGMIRLCEDAQVDPEDVAMLVLGMLFRN